MVRSHLACNDFYCPEDSYGSDWSLISVKLKGANIDLYAVYLTDGLGYTGENITKLSEVAASVK